MIDAQASLQDSRGVFIEQDYEPGSCANSYCTRPVVILGDYICALCSARSKRAELEKARRMRSRQAVA